MKHITKMLTLAGCLSVFALMALGSGSDSSTSDNDKNISSVENAEYTEAAAAEEPQETSSEEILEEAPQTAVTVPEQVIVDNGGIKVTVTGMEEGLFGTELKVLIENDTTSNLTFQVRNTAVNGYMVDTMISEAVAAGKKANSDITFMSSDLKKSGITTIAEMEFNFFVFDTDSWQDVLVTDPIHIYTSESSYVQCYDDSGEILYSSNGIKIVGKELSTEDSIFGPGLVVYIENNTGRPFTVQVRETSVNGFMIDTSMSQEILPGKKAISAVTFFSSSLEENGITDINSVETSFHIFDTDTWDTIVDTDSILINFI